MIGTRNSLIAIILLLASTDALSANLYKWRDWDGQVHYGQSKPTEFDYQIVNAPPPPPIILPDENQPPTERKSSNNRQKSAPTSGRQAKVEQKQCETARRNLEGLQTFSRIKYTDSSGETAVMPHDMKEARIAESKKQINFYCK